MGVRVPMISSSETRDHVGRFEDFAYGLVVLRANGSRREGPLNRPLQSY